MAESSPACEVVYAFDHPTSSMHQTLVRINQIVMTRRLYKAEWRFYKEEWRLQNKWLWIKQLVSQLAIMCCSQIYDFMHGHSSESD